MSHAFMAALNGVMISFRNYPGRTPLEVRRQMDKVAATLVNRFNPAESTGQSSTKSSL